MNKRNIQLIIFYSFLTLLIIVGTFFVTYFVQGYQFDREKGTLNPTGVTVINSSPSRAHVYLNNEDNSKGRTPETITGLDTGSHTILVKKDGYYDWTKDIDIEAEKTYPLNPYLILEEPKKETIFRVDNPIKDVFTDRYNNYIFIVTEKPLTSPEVEGEVSGNSNTTDTQRSLYKIWRYEINPFIWELNQNPILVYEKELKNTKGFNLKVSKDGERGILTVSQENQEAVYLLNLSNFNDKPQDLGLDEYLNDFGIKWSKNNDFLILESISQVLSYEIDENTTYLIFSKKSKTKEIWGIGDDNNIYIAEAAEDDKSYSYEISVTNIRGSDSDKLTEKLYSLKSREYIDNYNFKKPDERKKIQQPFTNSSENSRFTGRLTGITPVPETENVVLTTTEATYWFDSETEKFILVYPSSTQFLGINTGFTRVLFSTEDGSLIVFTFDKDEGDFTEDIGTEYLLDADENSSPSTIKWLPTSDYITYITEDGLFSIDNEKDNNYKIVEIKEFYTANRNGDLIYTIEENQAGSELVRYEIQ